VQWSEIRTRLSFHSYIPGRKLDLAGSLVCVLCSLCLPSDPLSLQILSLFVLYRDLDKQGQMIIRQRDHCRSVSVCCIVAWSLLVGIRCKPWPIALGQEYKKKKGCLCCTRMRFYEIE
jgi:hypothetical protein